MSDNNVTKLATREAIAPGTIVTLKSGGPHMTVVERTANYAHVTWIKDDGSDILSAFLALACLEVKK